MARALILVLVFTWLAACGQPLTPPTEAPDEPAYIEGTIVERDNRFIGASSARVAASEERIADVMLETSPIILWGDGRRGSMADLTPGRVISVWASDEELRSYPPVVSAEYILIQR